jgi:hypothetical protein
MSVTVYHDRALQLADAMKLCLDDLVSYASAGALLAVHSAISYNDAVLLKLKGRRSQTEDHRRAAATLFRVCRERNIDVQGCHHLKKLLSVKTDISYGDRIVDSETAEALCSSAVRFQTWAERLLSQP